MAFEKLKFKKVSNKHMLENSYASMIASSEEELYESFQMKKFPLKLFITQ